MAAEIAAVLGAGVGAIIGSLSVWLATRNAYGRGFAEGKIAGMLEMEEIKDAEIAELEEHITRPDPSPAHVHDRLRQDS